VPARVVIAHDEPSLLEPLAASLRGMGHEVATFRDSMRAWDALNGASRVDILITRVQFGPGQPHGIALAHSARARCPGLRVLFVAQPQFAGDAEGLGLFLALPVSVPEVAEAVGRMLANERLGQ
jgi:DNA-binding NtrC family response regulator